MKIAFICTEKLPVPPVSGGAIQIYINGVLPFVSKIHDVTVFSVQEGNLSEKESVDNIKYIRVQGKTTAEYLKNVIKLLEKDYELIHVFNRPAWVIPLSEAAPDSAFSLSLHNEMFLPEKISSEKAVQTIEKVKFITTVSKFIANGVKELYPLAEEKLRVVYSAVDINEYKPIWSQESQKNRVDIKKQYGLENHKVVLNVGRFSKKKGAHILIKAMKKVMDEYTNVGLVLVGSKWYGSNETDDYVRQVQLMTKELKGPVVFTGFLPPSEVPYYYNIGDIFVCASQWREPLARVHYEAMGAGLPIITTDRGGNAEVIQENVNGLIIKDYNNPEAFAKNISYLIENEDEAIEMGKNGREIAEKNYNWNRVADQLLEVFATV